MQTIYVDIYFLINFTVDLLSLHLASVFTKVRASVFGMLVSAFLGAGFAVLLLFLPEKTGYFAAGTLFFFLVIMFFCTRGCGIFRKIKYIIAFLMAEVSLGGMVYFFYGVLERTVEEKLFDEIKTNSSLIVISLISLLSIGVLKIILLLFRNNTSIKNVRLKVIIFEKEYFTDALVDSGNFAVDPMDMSPVMIVKTSFSKKIFPYGTPDISETHLINERIKKRIRAIPISTAAGSKLLCGFRPDAVFVLKNDGFEKINLTMAFDKEGGSFCGFDALIPCSALENI